MKARSLLVVVSLVIAVTAVDARAQEPPVDLQKLADTLNKTVNTVSTAAQGVEDQAQKLADKLNTAGAAVNKSVDDATQSLDAKAKALASEAAAANSAAQRLESATKAYKSATQRAYSHAAKSPLGDYVPCLFDDKENLDLRARPSKSYGVPFSSDEMVAITDSIKNILTPAVGVPASTDAAAIDPFNKNLSDRTNTFSYLPQESVEASILKLADEDHLSVDHVKQLRQFLRAISDLDTFNRPSDVSCSFSVLQYKETKDNFGWRVADQYVGLEVNIRNLNKQNEFLIHDIQIAVDTGLSSYEFGRFQASRDKQIVRGVVQHDEDIRNGILSALQAIGAILNPINSAVAQTIGGSNSDPAKNLGIGVGVFEGPFITGLATIFPDRTADFLNHLNDLGFSPSTTSKTVVPVQGSVPLVTFLAEKPLEQLPFVRCGQTWGLYYRTLDRSTSKIRNDDMTRGQLKKDGNPAMANCQLHPSYKFEDVDYDDTLTGNFQKPLRYKSWRGAAMNIFEHRVFVVVGGVHIKEVPDTATVDKVNCPVVSDQTIDLSQADSQGNISCTVSGSNLNQIASIKLEQGTAKTVAGTAAPSSDGNSATIGFPAAQFNGLTGSFELFLTTSVSQDIDAKQALSFGVRKPVFSNISSTFTGTVATGITLSVSIVNPDRIQSISLFDPKTGTKVDAAALPLTAVSTAQQPETLNFTADASKASALAAGVSVQLEFTSKDDATGAAPTPMTGNPPPSWILK